MDYHFLRIKEFHHVNIINLRTVRNPFIFWVLGGKPDIRVNRPINDAFSVVIKLLLYTTVLAKYHTRTLVKDL